MQTRSISNEEVGVQMSAGSKSESAAQAQGQFHLVCRDVQGKIEWEATAKNSLFNEGAAMLRDWVFNLNSVVTPTAPQMGLSTTNGLAATVTFATIGATEPSGGGYTRKTTTWVATAPAGANNTATPCTWTAVGTAIVGVYELFIAEQSNSKLLSHALLANGPYTVNVGSTLSVSYSWSVS